MKVTLGWGCAPAERQALMQPATTTSADKNQKTAKARAAFKLELMSSDKTAAEDVVHAARAVMWAHLLS